MKPPNTGPSNNRGSVRKSLIWAAFGQGMFFLLQFGSSVFLARLLGPKETGVFALGAATVGLVASLQALGLNNYLIRSDNLDRTTISTVFTVNLILSSIISLSIVVLGLFGERLFHDAGTVRVMLWLAVTPILNAISLVPQSLVQRDGDFRAISLVRIFSTVLGNGVTIVLALAGFSYMSLAYGWVLTSLATTVGACAIARQHVHLRLGLNGWRIVSNFGLKMLFINGATQVQRQLLNILVGRYFGLEAVGLYSRANSLFMLLMENTQTVAMRVFLADFSEAARVGMPLKPRYQKVVECMTALLWPMLAGLAVLAGPCVQLMFGARWQTVGPLLSLLSISGLIWVAISMSWELFVVANETRLQAKIELNKTLVGSMLFLIGCQLSLVAAAASRILDAIYAVILYGPPVARFAGCTAKDLIPAYAKSALLSVAAITPATILMIAYSWSPVTPLPLVMSSVVGGVVLWIVVLVRLRHPLVDEVKKMLRRKAQVRSG